MKKQLKHIAEKALGNNFYNRAVLPKHYGVALATNIKLGFPAKGLKVIAVTGTNGKTSTCFMIHKMLVEAGHKAGLLSTVAYGVGSDLKPQIHHMTSQPIGLLMSRIIEMKKAGMDVLVFEVTSHALAQFRTMGVPIDIAVMTNITHEHLDYHGSFEAYVHTKQKLFRQANRTDGMKVGVINADDPSAELFANAIENPLFYSLKKSDSAAYPKNLELTPKGSTYTTTIMGKVVKIRCNIPGEFNVANSLAAATAGIAFGLTPEQVGQGIAALDSVEGRMTRIDEGQDFDVIIDYAHTPDSFQQLFADMRPVVKGRLIALFGSAGRRDEAKRAIQGRIAGKYSDIVIVTEEDDRDVDGNMIMKQIAEGAESSGKVVNNDLFLILDRAKAVEFALKTAKNGDTVLLLGKGHEKTIERSDGEHTWDEIGLTRRLLSQSNER